MKYICSTNTSYRLNYTDEEIWKIIRTLQPMTIARMTFAVNMEVKLLMMTIMKVAEMKGMLPDMKLETVGYDYTSGLEIRWPSIHRAHIEF